MTKREKLEKLKKKAMGDKSLPKYEGATNLVFGDGNPNAEIVFIGEAPGHWEDLKGIPFVGNAGALLNQVLAMIEIERKDVFITNMVMYRPPGNRDPSPDELKKFSAYIDGILDIIAPKIIVTLGRFSMAKFLPGVYISTVHGKLHEVTREKRKIKIVPMYHPAAALRNGAVKLKFKQDFEDLKKLIDAPEEAQEEVKEKKEEKKAHQMQLV